MREMKTTGFCFTILATQFSELTGFVFFPPSFQLVMGALDFVAPDLPAFLAGHYNSP